MRNSGLMSLQYHGLIRKRSSIDRSYIPGTTVLQKKLHYFKRYLEKNDKADKNESVSKKQMN